MTGVVIGRFQVPYLHPGHLHLIATALRECEEVYILIGTPRPSLKRDERNPYGVPERVRMIQKIFPQVKIKVFYDWPGDDKIWLEELNDYCNLLVEPVLYHSRDSFKEMYSGPYPLREVEEVPGYSGTLLRKQDPTL